MSIYANYLKSTVDIDLKGLKLVIDCANGAAYKVAEKVFSELGAKVIAIHNDPNGININEICGSTHPEKLQEMVVSNGADVGLAFDGDADRLIAVDELGRIVDGDKVMYICAKMMKANGQLPGDLVTATVMSNLGLHNALEKIGCKLELTQVGDRYVLESMLKTGCAIGGEQSGHIIFLNCSTTGDGILSALQLIKAVRDSGSNLSLLADEVTIYPQVLKNAKVKNENKTKYMSDPDIVDEIRKLEEAMAGEGRVLIRPSGTEPMVRVMIEQITKLAENLASLLTEKFG
jgi:phosphoglucosamine mutase